MLSTATLAFSILCSRRHDVPAALADSLQLRMASNLRQHHMLKTVFGAGAATGPTYSPYTSSAANDIYNLLFCDKPEAFQPKTGNQLTSWQSTLASSNTARLQALASDESQEGRVRYLAFSKLRALGQSVPPKKLLGVIVEVPLSSGLDTLAAFSDGGVRYVNQTGKLAVLEDVRSIKPMVQRLFEVSHAIVQNIDPWGKTRLAPPKQGNVRLTFLVSDGLYFGEGPMHIMQREPLAGPVIQEATVLLQAVVAAKRN
jgi:hypothetical protein